MNKKYIIGAGVLLVFLAIVISMSSINQAIVDQGIPLDGMVCVYKNNELTQPCSHNLFRKAGKNWTRDLLGSWAAGGQAMAYIGIANGSAAGCDDDTDNEIDTRTPDGSVDTATNPAIATYAVNDVSDGNWTLSIVFEAQETINDINATGIWNDTGTPWAILACDNFTAVDLLQNDQINVTWYLWVT